MKDYYLSQAASPLADPTARLVAVQREEDDGTLSFYRGELRESPEQDGTMHIFAVDYGKLQVPSEAGEVVELMKFYPLRLAPASGALGSPAAVGSVRAVASSSPELHRGRSASPGYTPARLC